MERRYYKRRATNTHNTAQYDYSTWVWMHVMHVTCLLAGGTEWSYHRSACGLQLGTIENRAVVPETTCRKKCEQPHHKTKTKKEVWSTKLMQLKQWLTATRKSNSVPFQPAEVCSVLDFLHVTKRGHLPTELGPTLPSPRRGDRQDRGGGQVELWEVAQCSAERQREWWGARGDGGRGGVTMWTLWTNLRLLRRSPHRERERSLATDDARRCLTVTRG